LEEDDCSQSNIVAISAWNKKEDRKAAEEEAHFQFTRIYLELQA
jgi:hypothetical protein